MATDMVTDTDMAMKKKPRARARALSVGVLWCAASMSPLAMAQVLGDATPQVSGDGTPPKASISVVPRVSVTETWTDNALLKGVQQSDQITAISPGLRVDVNKARLKGSFDYALTQNTYAQGSAANNSSNALTSNLKLEAVENTFFIDATGSISQQAISAFGTQSVSGSPPNANSTEVSTYMVSPYLQGRLGGVANYLARFSRSVTSSGPLGDTATSEASLGLTGGNTGKGLGWTANADNRSVSYSAGRATENDTLTLGLTYALTPQFSVSAQAGSESNNYSSLDMQTNALTGVGFKWTPLDTSSFSWNVLQHSYGDTYQLSFDQRTGRTVWHYSNTKAVNQTTGQQGTANLGTAYDLYYAQFASIQPDPIARAQLVTAYLLSYGIAPGSAVTTGFVTNSLTLQNQQLLSFALLGVRDTVTVIATQSDSHQFDALTASVSDLAKSSSVQQQGVSVNLAHRLTPEYALSLLLSQVATTGSLSSQSTTLQSYMLSLSGKVGNRGSVSLGLRHVESASTLAPYIENAITGMFQLQF